jgi:nicotinamidase-related amidase
MERSRQTARELYEELKARPPRPRFGFGEKPALVNVDLQKVFTAVNEFKETAYEGDPRQMEYVNRLAALARARRFPVVWTYDLFAESGQDLGVWGERLAGTPHALQLISPGSRRAEFDDRLRIDDKTDILVSRRHPSSFFGTPLASLLLWNRVDTVIVTGGSSSGCVRATAVDSLSHGFRTIVPEECVADRHEGPHYANLYDMALKYADVLPVEEVIAHLEERRPGRGMQARKRGSD